MYTLKLYTDWLNKAEEKIRVYINYKYKNRSNLSKKQIKEIYNIIKTSKVIKNTDDFVVYALKT